MDDRKGSVNDEPKQLNSDKSDGNNVLLRRRRTGNKIKVIPDGYEMSPPEGGWGWVVLAGAVIMTTMMVIPGACFGILLQDIRIALDTSTAAVASAASVSMSTSNFISPLVTVAMHTFTCRKTAMFGGLLLSTGMCLSYFAQNIETLVITFGLLTGIGYGFCRISCLVLASRYFNKRYSLAASFLFTGFSLGRLLFSPLSQIIKESYGFRGTFLLMGGISMNILIGAAVFQPADWHTILRPIDKEDPSKPKKDVTVKTSMDMMVTQEHDHITEFKKNGKSIEEPYEEQQDPDGAEIELIKYRDLTKPTTAKRSNEGVNAVEGDENTKCLSHDSRDTAAVVIVAATKKNPEDLKQDRTSGKSWSLRNALDFSLLKDSTFYVILASQVLTYLALIYGILFLVPLGLDKGLTPMQAAVLPTFRAFAEIGGHIALPFLQTVCNFDPIIFYILISAVAGLGFVCECIMKSTIITRNSYC